MDSSLKTNNSIILESKPFIIHLFSHRLLICIDTLIWIQISSYIRVRNSMMDFIFPPYIKLNVSYYVGGVNTPNSMSACVCPVLWVEPVTADSYNLTHCYLEFFQGKKGGKHQTNWSWNCHDIRGEIKCTKWDVRFIAFHTIMWLWNNWGAGRWRLSDWSTMVTSGSTICHS